MRPKICMVTLAYAVPNEVYICTVHAMMVLSAILAAAYYFCGTSQITCAFYECNKNGISKKEVPLN